MGPSRVMGAVLGSDSFSPPRIALCGRRSLLRCGVRCRRSSLSFVGEILSSTNVCCFFVRSGGGRVVGLTSTPTSRSRSSCCGLRRLPSRCVVRSGPKCVDR